MTRSVTMAVVVLVFVPFVASQGGEREPPVRAAQGTIDRVEQGQLILELSSPAGSNSRLSLKITGASRLSAMKCGERAGKIALTQHSIAQRDLRPKQPIAVIYADNSSGAVLVAAVVQLESPERAADDPASSPKLPAGVPAKVATVLMFIDQHERAPDGYEGGRTFHNYGSHGETSLPRRDARGNTIRYQEWDVHPKVPGKNRGAERLVTGSDGGAYYTSDHYRTFIKIR
jgi:guanyl-specific ribonuclease Sa